MSHTVKCNVDMTNVDVLILAVSALDHHGFSIDTEVKRRKLFSTSANGLAVHLPGWRYPVVIDPETGDTTYDNYNGAWGKIEHLDLLSQQYSAEAVKQTAEMQGYQVTTETLENGDVKLEAVQWV